jgi:hypothetical protein
MHRMELQLKVGEDGRLTLDIWQDRRGETQERATAYGLPLPANAALAAAEVAMFVIGWLDGLSEEQAS